MSYLKAKDLIKIAVVDDDLSVCQLASNHINTLEKCKVLIQATDGQEFLDKLKETPEIDLVILDIRMDGLDGYSTAEIIRSQYPEIRIVFYSVCKTELALFQMAVCGGHGLIRKGKSVEQFATAIKTVMGGNYFFPDMEERLAIPDGRFSLEKRNKVFGLSIVEIAFLKLAATEMPYKEIAAEMHLEIRQVEYIRECVFKRLHAKSRIGLTIIAYQSGILPARQAV